MDQFPPLRPSEQRRLEQQLRDEAIIDRANIALDQSRKLLRERIDRIGKLPGNTDSQTLGEFTNV